MIWSSTLNILLKINSVFYEIHILHTTMFHFQIYDTKNIILYLSVVTQSSYVYQT